MSIVGTFKIESRTEAGGGASRKLRRSGFIPGILYGGEVGQENVLITIDPRDVEKNLTDRGFYTKIFELDINGKKEQALAREVQFHPVTDRPLHIDFWRVGKNTKIHVAVPFQFINESTCPGIKLGGMLNIVLHALEVTCSASEIPTHLTVDLAGLEIGSTIHMDAIQLPNGVSVTHPHRDNTIATIIASKAESTPAPAETVTPVAAKKK